MYKHYKIAFLLLFIFYADTLAATTDVYKFKTTFQSASGAVVFDHEAHAMGRVKDCSFCHSALKTFGGEVNELFAHKYCKICHESKGGPTECNGCHSGMQAPIE